MNEPLGVLVCGPGFSIQGWATERLVLEDEGSGVFLEGHDSMAGAPLSPLAFVKLGQIQGFSRDFPRPVSLLRGPEHAR